MRRTAVDDHPINAALLQFLVQGALRLALGEKGDVAHFDAVAEAAWQPVEKAPELVELGGRERSGQLQPVLNDAISQRIEQAQKVVQQIVGMLQLSLMADGLRKLKAEAEVVMGHIAPALHAVRRGSA